MQRYIYSSKTQTRILAKECMMVGPYPARVYCLNQPIPMRVPPPSMRFNRSGLARCKMQTYLSTGLIVGTPAYVAPEMVTGGGKSDGITCKVGSTGHC